MKRERKILKLLKNNIKVVTAFVVGVLISGIAVYAETKILAGQVEYTNNNQETVDGALDDLYTKARTYIKPSDYSIVVSSNKRIMGNILGICVNRGQGYNRGNCFAAYYSSSEENSDRFENEVKSNFESWGGSCSWSGGFGFVPNYILTCTDNSYYTLTLNTNTMNWTVESIQNAGEKCEYSTIQGSFASVTCN